jgi:putative endonuclease
MSRAIGNKGEDLAARYLRSNGFHIITRNYYIRGGEIDIIFTDCNTTVFCEVKQRASKKYGEPSQAVDYHKQQRICRAALDYSSKNKNVDENYRFDIIEIIDNCVNHIKNAFEFIEPK